MTTIIALDPGRNTGWAWSDGATLRYGTWDLGPSLGARPGILADLIRAEVEIAGCNVLAYEVATMGGKFPHAQRALNELCGVIQAVGSEMGLRLYAFPIGTWKARAVGNGSAKKPAVQRGLRTFYGLVIDSEDAADAVGILKASELGPPDPPKRQAAKALEKKLKATQPLLFGTRRR